jgi:hypothetical protein
MIQLLLTYRTNYFGDNRIICKRDVIKLQDYYLDVELEQAFIAQNNKPGLFNPSVST